MTERREPAAAARRSGPWRWSRRVAIVVLAGVSVYFAVQWGLHSSYFSVQRVEVHGEQHETRRDILAASGLATHPAMIDVHNGTVEQRLDALSWVASSRVQLQWPHTVVITVVERVPVAVARDADGHLWLVDATGQKIVRTPSSTTYPLLQAVGATASDGWSFTSWAENAAVVASQLPLAFRSQVARVEITHADVVTLALTTPLTLVLGTPTQLHQKFVAAAAVLAHPYLLHTGDVVDLSVPASPTVSGP